MASHSLCERAIAPCIHTHTQAHAIRGPSSDTKLKRTDDVMRIGQKQFVFSPEASASEPDADDVLLCVRINFLRFEFHLFV